jgi:2-polyprenyl-3-methyl-5-hydroxy-6-metoxy-1,4-benzoquinol methylase
MTTSDAPEVYRCWICGGPGRPFRRSTITREVDDASVRITDSNYGETAALSECPACGFRFAAPIPHPDILRLYCEMEDQPYQDSSDARRAQMRVLLDLISTVRPQARTFLDIGAGTGLMVSEARARGLDAHGIEPSQWCVATAAASNHIELFQGTTTEWIGRLPRYDVVTLVDVIEHTTDPIGMLRDATALLKPGGALLVVTPDVGSMAARMMGRWWWHYRVAHVGYFNRASMRRAMREVGLRLELDTFATWQFQASYLAERFARYVPVFPFANMFRALARSPRMQRTHVDVNLRDSRAFIASTAHV